MTSFPLKIVSPDGLIFDGPAEKVIVRTITGDMGFMAHHMNCVCPLGMGKAIIESDGNRREAACIGGMISAVDGEITLVPTTFEWAEKIDSDRADASYQRAQKILQSKESSDTEIRLAEARLKRALVRKSVVSGK